ncbi:MAG: arylsulfatase [Planctomycetota bacterium]
MNRWLLLLLCCSLGSRVSVAQAAHPNIVLILADDLGFSDLGCYGGEIATPTLDRIADEGVRFTQFYNTARCWPSRAALLTGYYAQQVNRDPQGERPPWAALLPQLLQPSGYRSYHSGKWHVDGPVLAGGFQRSYLVVDTDRFFNPRDHKLDDQPLPQPSLTDGYYTTTAITDRALEFLGEHARDHAEDPFFLYLAYTSPHFPVQAPASDVAKYRGKYAEGWEVLRERRWKRMRAKGIVNTELSALPPEVPAWVSLSESERDSWDARMAVHAAMVDRMDREISRVVDWLEKNGELKRTVIVFCSDNGASAENVLRGDGNDPNAMPGSAATFLCIEPPWASLANAPLRKSKIFTHEGGISTPLLVRWPEGIPSGGQLRTTPGHLIDIVPTLLDVADAEPPPNHAGESRPTLPGRSLVPAFVQNAPIDREFLFFKHSGNRALRVGDWKIVASGQDAPWELYDLKTDRAEQRDLADKEPARVQLMAQIWERQDQEYSAQGASGKVPTNRKTRSKSR